LEHPNPKTKEDYTEKCRKLTEFLGYEDAARVTPEEIVSFKEHLLKSAFAPKSVQNVFDDHRHLGQAALGTPAYCQLA
jgi:hypothetical protein